MHAELPTTGRIALIVGDLPRASRQCRQMALPRPVTVFRRRVIYGFQVYGPISDAYLTVAVSAEVPGLCGYNLTELQRGQYLPTCRETSVSGM